MFLSKNGSSLWLKYAIWVLGADNVPPAKPARRLSAHVPPSLKKNLGDFSSLEELY